MSAPQKSTDLTIATTTALKAYSELSRRLTANWHLLRNCTLNSEGEMHFVQLIVLHRDYGIGLIDFRHPDYAFPELAVRLTRSVLEAHGLNNRFPGFLPIVFLSTTANDARGLQKRLTDSFKAQPKLTIGDVNWADWAFGNLRINAEEGRAARTEGEQITPEIHIMERAPGVNISRGLALGIALGITASLGVSGFLVTEIMKLSAERPGPGASKPGVESVHSAAWSNTQSRLMSEAGVASYLGLDLATFRERQAALLREGFPHPIAVTGAYDRQAVDRWIESESGRAPPPEMNEIQAQKSRPAAELKRQ